MLYSLPNSLSSLSVISVMYFSELIQMLFDFGWQIGFDMWFEILLFQFGLLKILLLQQAPSCIISFPTHFRNMHP